MALGSLTKIVATYAAAGAIAGTVAGVVATGLVTSNQTAENSIHNVLNGKPQSQETTPESGGGGGQGASDKKEDDPFGDLRINPNFDPNARPLPLGSRHANGSGGSSQGNGNGGNTGGSTQSNGTGGSSSGTTPGGDSGGNSGDTPSGGAVGNGYDLTGTTWEIYVYDQSGQRNDVGQITFQQGKPGQQISATESDGQTVISGPYRPDGYLDMKDPDGAGDMRLQLSKDGKTMTGTVDMPNVGSGRLDLVRTS